jgi:phospholipid-binding lipoprotein MlaA
VAAPSLAAAQEAAPEAVVSGPTAEDGVRDPWEGFNRNLYAVHDSVDRAVLEPVARGYRAVTPGPVRRGVVNFLRNLRSPVIFANDLLQGEISRAGTTAVRFGINSTVGIAGAFDPATNMGLERHDEDFGQTLAVWGVGSGPYIFVPLMGPTTVRDGAGRIVDIAFDPLTWFKGDDINTIRATRTIVAGISAREEVLDTVDDIRATSVDPYVTIRSSYGLLRQSAIQNGPANVQDLPDFEDIDETPETSTPETGADPQHVGEIQNSPDAVTLAQSFYVPISEPNLEE